jgi:hypothetical protein
MNCGQGKKLYIEGSDGQKRNGIEWLLAAAAAAALWKLR